MEVEFTVYRRRIRRRRYRQTCHCPGQPTRTAPKPPKLIPKGRYQSSSREYAQVETTLRQHVAAMCQQRDAELADPKLREPCRKALTSLLEHWSGLTVFLDDPRIPLDNNFAERLMRNPALGRKNYYGSGATQDG